MKLLQIDETQLVVLLNVARSAGPLPWHTLIEAIQSEFNFADLPDAKSAGEGARFRRGSFKGVALDSLAVHDDGLVLTSRAPSDFLEKVYEHLIKVAVDQFGFEVVRTHKIDQFYRSAITIQSDVSLLSVLRGIDKIRESLERALTADTGIKASYVPASIAFASDPQKNIVKPIGFRLERKAGVDFDFGQYFSEAPLTTESHLHVLEELEKLAA